MALDEDFLLQASENFVVELATETLLKKVTVLITYNTGSGDAAGTETYPKFPSNLGSSEILSPTDAIDSSAGKEIFGATAPGFVVNYSYPTYLVACGSSVGTAYYFGLQVTYVSGGSDVVVYRSFRCTV
jgi:hypothetical protein